MRCSIAGDGDTKDNRAHASVQPGAVVVDRAVREAVTFRAHRVLWVDGKAPERIRRNGRELGPTRAEGDARRGSTAHRANTARVRRRSSEPNPADAIARAAAGPKVVRIARSRAGPVIDRDRLDDKRYGDSSQAPKVHQAAELGSWKRRAHHVVRARRSGAAWRAGARSAGRGAAVLTLSTGVAVGVGATALRVAAKRPVGAKRNEVRRRARHERRFTRATSVEPALEPRVAAVVRAARDAAHLPTRNDVLRRARALRAAHRATAARAALVALLAPSCAVAGDSAGVAPHHESLRGTLGERRARRTTTTEATDEPELARACARARGPAHAQVWRVCDRGARRGVRALRTAAPCAALKLRWARVVCAARDGAVAVERRVGAAARAEQHRAQQRGRCLRSERAVVRARRVQSTPPSASVAPPTVGKIIAVLSTSSRLSPGPRATSHTTPPTSTAPAVAPRTIDVLPCSRTP